MARYEPELLEPTPDWTDAERPAIPGSASTPGHTLPFRAAYFFVGVLMSLTAGLGNAMISVNLPQIQGDLGLTPVEGAWLPAAYTMVNVSSNLILFKLRQQFGVRRFAEVAITVNLVVMATYFLIDNYEMALTTRAISGFAAAPMSSLAFMYMLQAFPKAKMGSGLCIALGFSQLSLPLAYVMSPSLVGDNGWQVVNLFEFGMVLCGLACIFALKLPPSIRIKVIEPLDFLTVSFIAPGLALVVAVMAQGRIQWWTEQAWMGWALIAGLALLLIGFYLEHYRERPLIQTRWLGTMEVFHFVLGAFTLRFLLSEQSYAATGLLKALGAGPDQLVELYVVIASGVVAGFLVGALTFGPKAMIPQVLAAVILIAVGSIMDHDASSLTRPHDLLLSQFLISMAAGMFTGPILLMGVMGALKRGSDYIITFVILFGMSQAFGGSAGSAIFGTFQQYRQHEYSALISADINMTNPLVANRIATYGQIYGRVVTDPARRQAQGVAMLSQQATTEANVRAYNDVFVLNAIIAISYLIWSLADLVVKRRKSKSNPPPAAAANSVAA